MLKDLAYQGVYRNEDMEISVMMVNPLEHNLTADMLVFNVTINSGHGDTVIWPPDNFTFYLMDEASMIYNLKPVPYLITDVETGDGNEPLYRYGLIYTAFKPEFLFQDLRVAFLDRWVNKLELVRLVF
jgi:hypothetical protein